MPAPRLTFLGAAGEVTGSATLVETGRSRVLIDFGMFQGSAEDERRNLVAPEALDAAHLDAVLITHAHVDHCGRLPLLPRLGSEAPIHCTEPTADLLAPVLHSSARVQQIRLAEHRALSATRPGAGVTSRRTEPRAQARGPLSPLPSPSPPPPPSPEPTPIYTPAEVDASLRHLVRWPYAAPIEITPDITARFLDAGHVIGSASVHLTIREGAATTTLVFSGDLGPRGAPLLPQPAPPDRADAVVLESTYGGRVHPAPGDTLAALARIIADARRTRDKVIVPTFSIGRAQQLLAAFAQLSRDGRLLGTPVYLDSKLALTASEVYARFPALLDEPARAALARGHSPLQFPELHYILDRRDSMRLNRLHTGGVIVAGSGFCTGGPVVHHLAASLWRPDARVLLVGHQAAGTPAAALASGAATVDLGGATVDVVAKVHAMPGFSGHADEPDLLAWLRAIPSPPGVVLLNHGDDHARAALEASIRAQLPADVRRPTPDAPTPL